MRGGNRLRCIYTSKYLLTVSRQHCFLLHACTHQRVGTHRVGTQSIQRQHLRPAHSNGTEREGNGVTPLCHTRPHYRTDHCTWTAAKQQKSHGPFVPQQTRVTDQRSVTDKYPSRCLSLISNNTETPYQKAEGKSPPSPQKTTIKTIMGTQERPCYREGGDAGHRLTPHPCMALPRS